MVFHLFRLLSLALILALGACAILGLCTILMEQQPSNSIFRSRSLQVPWQNTRLEECKGDCDFDSDCRSGLICFQRSAGDAVPGCQNDENDSWGTYMDFCVDARAVGIFSAQEATEEPIIPGLLQECESDCDRDNDCDGNLVCFQKSANFPIPGCSNPYDDWVSKKDFCVDSTQLQGMQAVVVGNNGVPASVFPLGKCHGDCDNDRDCAWGLYCHQRADDKDEIPGCQYDPAIVGPNQDFCVPLPTLLPDAFRLRLYWEEGYVWQEETKEFFWCATTQFNGYPGKGKCWYGNDTVPCQEDQMYMARCSGTGLSPQQQAFRFVLIPMEFYDDLDDDNYNISNGFTEEVLIQVADVVDLRCWERFKREIFLRDCNASNPYQRWWANNGTEFLDEAFEISQVDFEQQCVTNDHHPKPGEVVELHACPFSRSNESLTSLWTKW